MYFKKSRRDFIKDISFISTGALMASLTPWLACSPAIQSSETDKPVHIAIVGTGSRGTLLLDNLLKINSVKIVALCDNYAPHLKKAVEMVKGQPVKEYTDYRKLLEDKNIQGIVIATPLYLHAQMTVDFLMAGKHVYCEKSMAMTVEDCKKMVIAQRETKRVLFVGHQRLYSSVFNKAFEIVKNCEIGAIKQVRAFWHRNNNWRRDVSDPKLERQINWRLYREFSCGLMTELASHQIHVSNWFLGQNPVSVYGSGSINFWKDGREVFDNVNLVYKYPDGTHMLYDSMISNKHYGLEEQFMGDLGTLEPEKGRMFFEKPKKSPGIVQLIQDAERGVFHVLPMASSSWIPEIESEDEERQLITPFPNSDGTYETLDAFARSVESGIQPPQILEQAYYATAWTLLGLQAMEKNEIVVWKKEYELS